MNRKMIRTSVVARPLTAAVAASALLLTPALAAEQGSNNTFQSFDADKDRSVSSDEFNAGMQRVGTFGELDQDQSTRVDMRELKSGVFRYLDDDNDGDIEPDTFTNKWQAWFQSEPPTLEAIDTNNNGVVDEREWENADVDLGLYGDTSGQSARELTEEEFYAGIYDNWDANADERLAEDEWFQSGDGERWPLGQ